MGRSMAIAEVAARTARTDRPGRGTRALSEGGRRPGGGGGAGGWGLAGAVILFYFLFLNCEKKAVEKLHSGRSLWPGIWAAFIFFRRL